MDTDNEKTVVINGQEKTVILQSTKIGDIVYDFNHGDTFEASIHDADDLNWIVQTKDVFTIYGCGKFQESTKHLNRAEAALLYIELHKFLKL